jgi:hypothetical protein
VFDFKSKPSSVQHLLGGWMKTFRNKDKPLVTVGVAAILWAILKTWNNDCFRSIRPNDPMVTTNLIEQLVFSWSILQGKEENRNALNWGAKLVVRLSSETFQAARGWRPTVQRLAG